MSSNNTSESSEKKALPKYRLIGKSGLRVFPLCLGTMGFGNNALFHQIAGLKVEQDEAEKIMLRYIEAGGNFIDTANFYQMGQSEVFIGDIIKKNNINRDDLIIATKYTASMSSNANHAGNTKKNMMRCVNESLKRLQMDYIDIFYVHFYDHTVDPKVLIQSMNELLTSGKVLHIGISDFPAWYVAKANLYAEMCGISEFICYQGKYSLVERTIEDDVVPMCIDSKMKLVCWGILGGGKLTGKRSRSNPEGSGDSKRKVQMTENDFLIQDELVAIAKEINRSPSQVAYNYILNKRAVGSLLIGPSSLEQLEDNLKVLEFKLNQEQMEKLDRVSSKIKPSVFPHNMVGKSVQDPIYLYMPVKRYEIEE